MISHNQCNVIYSMSANNCNTFSQEKLRGRINYGEWKIGMKNVLIQENLQKSIRGYDKDDTTKAEGKKSA